MKAKKGAKSKLTLSVRPKYVAMLRRASARSGKSITELVEDVAEQLDARAQSSTKELWADRMNGRFAGGFTDEDYKRTDLLGALLRKHLPGSKA